MTTSSKGSSEKRKITHYLTNTVLDSQFRGTTQQFVLHFNEQFKRLDDLTDISERMPDSIKMALFQNAVKDIPQLSIVETLDEYTSTTCGNGSFTHLNYSSYYNLLINACVRYDATKTSTPSKRRNVLEFDKENNNTKWADATRDEMDCIKEQQVFTKGPMAKWDPQHKKILNAPPNHQKIRVNLIFAVKYNEA